MPKPKYNLEERLVKFGGESLLFLNDIPKDTAGSNLGSQLTRSVTSSALNFGEYQGAESIKDGIHKLGIVLKELKESRVALKILAFINYGNVEERQHLLSESNELAAIIATIIKKKRRLL
jgi:four helix bundle protein